MKHIKQLQSIKFDGEGCEFTDKIADVKDVWGLFVYTHEPKEGESTSDFYLNVGIDLVGTVFHCHDGSFTCNLNRTDFQSEYTEDELKKVIIEDITFEIILGSVYEKDTYENLENDLKNFNDFTKEGIDTITPKRIKDVLVESGVCK